MQALDAAGREATDPAEGTAAEEDIRDRIALGFTENTALAALRAAEEAVAAAGVHNEDLDPGRGPGLPGPAPPRARPLPGRGSAGGPIAGRAARAPVSERDRMRSAAVRRKGR